MGLVSNTWTSVRGGPSDAMRTTTALNNWDPTFARNGDLARHKVHDSARQRRRVEHAAGLTAIILPPVKPDLVCVNETFSIQTVDHISCSEAGYSDGRKHRGVVAFALVSIAERVTLIQSSEAAEWIWLLAHADLGPHLVGIRYRPPNPGDTATIDTFKAELRAVEGAALSNATSMSTAHSGSAIRTTAMLKALRCDRFATN